MSKESIALRTRSALSATTAARAPHRHRVIWVGVAAAGVGALLWSYWPILVSLVKDWQSDDDYSVGQLVPLAALYLLWRERSALRKCRVRPCWWGVAVILIAFVGRAYGLVFLYDSAERYSLVLTVVGVVLLVGGWGVFRQVFWILMFLFLMVPLPGRVHNLISGPLQTQATTGAVFLLELFGVTVTREGNVILLNNDIPLAVAEACSGLRMLTAFVVVAAVLAYLVTRPRWQKIALLVSSIPIAIACNLGRLCVTAVLYIVASSETAELFFHDFAGLAMMPLAVLILLGELWLMNKLVTPEEAPTAPARVRANNHNTHRKANRGK